MLNQIPNPFPCLCDDLIPYFYAMYNAIFYQDGDSLHDCIVLLMEINS